jgi:hypothetical protein
MLEAEKRESKDIADTSMKPELLAVLIRCKPEFLMIR